MAVIGGSDYRNVSDEYSIAYGLSLDVKDNLFNAVYLIVLLQSIEPEVDLLQEFWDSYLINSPLYSSSLNLSGAVSTMQTHVLTRGGYATVDAYLDAEGIQVAAGWAELSSDAGFPISAGNIE